MSTASGRLPVVEGKSLGARAAGAAAKGGQRGSRGAELSHASVR
jgi:hypothetical protein